MAQTAEVVSDGIPVLGGHSRDGSGVSVGRANALVKLARSQMKAPTLVDLEVVVVVKMKLPFPEETGDALESFGLVAVTQEDVLIQVPDGFRRLLVDFGVQVSAVIVIPPAQAAPFPILIFIQNIDEIRR